MVDLLPANILVNILGQSKCFYACVHACVCFLERLQSAYIILVCFSTILLSKLKS